jgi:zinc-ribbon domain
MFCPKCGQSNPETGKFCRSCGTDLGNVSNALEGKPAAKPLLDRKGREVTWEGPIRQIALGVAFMVVSFILGVSGMGRGWWFWMLIPAFLMLGSGVAKIVQLQQAKQAPRAGFVPADQPSFTPSAPPSGLPSASTDFAPGEIRYKTGDLVPPSVTDGTTRHLELDSEGKTMTLPKK